MLYLFEFWDENRVNREGMYFKGGKFIIKIFVVYSLIKFLIVVFMVFMMLGMVFNFWFGVSFFLYRLKK